MTGDILFNDCTLVFPVAWKLSIEHRLVESCLDQSLTQPCEQVTRAILRAAEQILTMPSRMVGAMSFNKGALASSRPVAMLYWEAT